MKLSVIVPCYNVAQYLEGFLACLDKQWGEHDHYEVVFVNDGSTDSTPSFLAEYVAADTRHRVLINQENQGLSGARNAGMKVARGEWITFPDPDDLLVDGAYGYVMEHFLDDSIDVLSFKYLSINKNESCNLNRLMVDSVLWEGRASHKKGHLTPNVWSYIYRRSVVEDYHIHFSIEATFGEDALFNAELFSKGVRMRMVNAICVCYVQHRQSICHTCDPIKLRRSVEGLLYCIEEVLKLDSPHYSVANWVNRFVMTIFSFVLRSDMNVRELRAIRNRLRDLKVFPLTSPHRTERICFKILEHPWLLPIVRAAVRTKHSFKKG